MARSDKRKMVDSMAEEAEKAAQMNQIEILYRINKQCCNTNKHQACGIRINYGELVVQEEE